MIRLISIQFFLLWFVFAHSQTLVIEDPLTNGTTKGIEYKNESIVKSSFSSHGYQPGADLENQNHILYDVPYMFREGYMEFEIYGMENPTLETNDPAFCAIYDGRGITEPIRYTNDFKQNYYRWNVHFRGDNHVFKSKIQMAPNTGIMELRDKPVFTDITGSYSDEGECVTEPNGQPMTWTKNKWYKLKVEWKDNKYTVYLDGIEIWTVTLTCEYTPRDMKIWLGCAPGKNGKYTATTSGLTFRNFKLYSYEKPIFNCGYNSVNLTENAYLNFSDTANHVVSEKPIFIENLGVKDLNIKITQNNSNFSISESTFLLAPGERKTLLVKINSSSPNFISTKFNITSPAFTKTYGIKCSAESN